MSNITYSIFKILFICIAFDSLKYLWHQQQWMKSESILHPKWLRTYMFAHRIVSWTVEQSSCIFLNCRIWSIPHVYVIVTHTQITTLCSQPVNFLLSQKSKVDFSEVWKTICSIFLEWVERDAFELTVEYFTSNNIFACQHEYNENHAMDLVALKIRNW